MPTYTYQSLTQGGQSRAGVLTAADRGDAIRQLLGRGETATSIEQADDGKPAGKSASKPVFSQPKSAGPAKALSFSRAGGKPSLSRVEMANLIRELATALEATALFIFMRKRLNGIEGKSIWDGAWRVGLAGLGMAIGLLMWIQATGSQTRWLVALGGVALGGVTYFVGVVLLKVPEVKTIMEAVLRRIKK